MAVRGRGRAERGWRYLPGWLTADRVIIHGEFTTDNVLAPDAPPEPHTTSSISRGPTVNPLSDVGYVDGG